MLAAIYERSGRIANPGGYLRHLTERMVQGQFSTTPMILALLTAKLKEGRGGGSLLHSAPSVEPQEGEGSRAPSSIPISAALRQRLGNGSTGRVEIKDSARHPYGPPVPRRKFISLGISDRDETSIRSESC
jgi:replication initiation protein RepC